jgi:hypothetical protein
MPAAIFYTFGPIWIEFGKWGIYRNPLSDYEFRENRRSESHTLLRPPKNVSLFVFSWSENRYKVYCIMLLSIFNLVNIFVGKAYFSYGCKLNYISACTLKQYDFFSKRRLGTLCVYYFTGYAICNFVYTWHIPTWYFDSHLYARLQVILLSL